MKIELDANPAELADILHTAEEAYQNTPVCSLSPESKKYIKRMLKAVRKIRQDMSKSEELQDLIRKQVYGESYGALLKLDNGWHEQ